MDIENGHSPVANGDMNGFVKRVSIPPPESIEHAQLLLLVSIEKTGKNTRCITSKVS